MYKRVHIADEAYMTVEAVPCEADGPGNLRSRTSAGILVLPSFITVPGTMRSGYRVIFDSVSTCTLGISVP